MYGYSRRTLEEVKAHFSGVTCREAIVSHHATILGQWWDRVDIDEVFALVANESARGTLTVRLDGEWFVVKYGEVVYMAWS